jgi:hypothetical protein
MGPLFIGFRINRVNQKELKMGDLILDRSFILIESLISIASLHIFNYDFLYTAAFFQNQAKESSRQGVA